MAKSKGIYTIKGIFSDFLSDVRKNNFLIPTYQRGYKWASKDENGHVNILLNDLFNAYTRSSPRYYLQFLTVKNRGSELEVIDGQQRLTTLTILFCLLAHRKGLSPSENFVLGKLKYQVRENFIDKYIYNNIELILSSSDWNNFIIGNEEHDNQDVYFIYHATKAIQGFLLTNFPQQTQPFYDYLCRNVSLIVNHLEETMNSEKVFINVNKGVRLNDGDLVKALLITKLPLDAVRDKRVMTSETEINEIRTNIGRQWDEIANWSSDDQIIDYFRIESSENRLEWLIRIAYPDIKADSSSNPLFTYFDQLYRDNNATALEIFNRIRKTKLVMNDWLADVEISNLLGFLLHARKNAKTQLLWQELEKAKTKNDILIALKKNILDSLPLNQQKDSLKELNFEDNKDELFIVFLMLDVFKFLPLNNRQPISYDFGNISSGQWSLEHIFPQNAKDFKDVGTLMADDIKIIIELLPPIEAEIKIEQADVRDGVLAIYRKIHSSSANCTINIDEKSFLGHLLNYNAIDLHGIGNMALLERNINSSLSNHYFDAKRKRLVQKISTGHFVPFHTYDVFSKLVIQTDTGLHVWSKADILAHEGYIKSQIKSIIAYLIS